MSKAGYENVLKKKLRENQPTSRTSYMTGAVARALSVRADRERDAVTDYRHALPTYGARAEVLGTHRLGGSGYAAYLARRAEDTKNARMDSAARGYLESLATAERGYAAYLTDYEKRQDTLAGTVSAEIGAQSRPSLDDAYAYAVGRGLEEGRARRAAERGVKSAYEALRKSVLSYISSHAMSATEIIAYARAAGLEESDAAALSVLGKEEAENHESGSEKSLSDMSAAELAEYIRRRAAEQAAKERDGYTTPTDKKGKKA